MTVVLSRRDEDFVQTMADFVDTTPDNVVKGIIGFFIRKGLALAELGEAISKDGGRPKAA